MPDNLSVCPLCASRRIQPRWTYLHYWHCLECRLLFRNPMPSAEELDSLYRESWLTPESSRSETGGTGLHLARRYARRLARSLAVGGFQGLRLLDFGAGRGSMLQAFSELGADAFALEPFGHNYLGQLGFAVYRSLDDVPGDIAFDGIVCVDVVEHLPAPLNELRKLNNLLRKGGWLYLATPNAAGLNARMTRGNWQEARKRGHLCLFEPANLPILMTKAGFGRVNRVRWLVRYSRDPLRLVFHYLLQIAGLDGELRYLAWKS